MLKIADDSVGANRRETRLRVAAQPHIKNRIEGWRRSQTNLKFFPNAVAVERLRQLQDRSPLVGIPTGLLNGFQVTPDQLCRIYTGGIGVQLELLDRRQ